MVKTSFPLYDEYLMEQTFLQENPELSYNLPYLT